MNLPRLISSLLRPAPDEINDLVPRIVRDPGPGQSSPSVFLEVHMLGHQFGQSSSLVWIFFSSKCRLRMAAFLPACIASVASSRVLSLETSPHAAGLRCFCVTAPPPFPTEPDHEMKAGTCRKDRPSR